MTAKGVASTTGFLCSGSPAVRSDDPQGRATFLYMLHLRFDMLLLRDSFTDLETRNQPAQFISFLCQAMCCCRRLLDHSRVLLRDLIHLVDCGVDLHESSRLFIG